MLWVGIGLPALSLEGFIATLGAEAAGPVALLDRQVLVAVNGAAREAGLRPGLKRATALALAPQVRLGEADPGRDAAALQAVAHAAMAFTPAVSVASDAVVLAEVQASLRCFGGLPRLREGLRAALHPLGHVLRIACAPTPQGAHWLAAWRDDAEAQAPWPPDPGWRAGPPPGAGAGPLPGAGAGTAADAPGWRDRLGGLPLARIAAAGPHLPTLQTLGLHTIADLWRQPRAGLVRRFGARLLGDIDRALGDLADPRESLAPPLRFDGRLELFQRADDSVALLAAATVLLNRLVAWAAARHGRIGAFRLLLHHETRLRTRHDPQARTTALEIGLGEPVTDPAHLQALLREHLQRLPLAASVIELGLQCDALVPGPPPNGELFPSAVSEGLGWQRLLERLEARLGAQQVQRLRAVADHRPDDSCPPPGAAPADWPRQRRPVWLLSQPLPLREEGGTPWLAGRPLWLVAGPERIETAWWDERPAARDYFIAQADDGALLWIYRFRHAPPAGESGWFLHGRYG